MKILVIGSGGREHTLVWKLNQSDKVKTIYCAPGNAGIKKLATCVKIGSDDIDGGDGTDLLGFWWLNYNGIDHVEVDLAAGTAQGFDGSGLSFTDTISNIENVNGTEYNDNIFGDDLSNSIWGDDGDDSISGRAGNDSLFGGAGDDTFSFTDSNSLDTVADFSTDSAGNSFRTK